VPHLKTREATPDMLHSKIQEMCRKTKPWKRDHCNAKERATSHKKRETDANKLKPCRNQLTSAVPIGTFYTQSLPANYAGFLKIFHALDCIHCVQNVRM